jgi:hypothetical protein
LKPPSVLVAVSGLRISIASASGPKSIAAGFKASR